MPRATRYPEIAREIRLHVLRQDLEPGAPLPRHEDWADRLGTSKRTVQKAIDLLSDEGLVDALRNRGTVVGERPAHRHRIALVFPRKVREGDRGGFLYQALAAASVGVGQELGVEFPIYDGLDLPDGAASWERLRQDAADGRLGGALLVHMLVLMCQRGWPLWELSPLPLLNLGRYYIPQVPALAPDLPTAVDQACSRIAEQGLRRVATVNISQSREYLQPAVEAATRRHGLDCPAWWQQHVLPTGVDACVRLLLMAPPEQRPQAILATDDNLAPLICRALDAAGIAPAHAPLLLSIANAPYFPAVSRPVEWIAFSAPALLRRSVHLLAEQRAGRPLPNRSFFLPLSPHPECHPEPVA